ncbi:MAG: DUF6478 family protein [Pseudomonadota bacterium]
MILQAADRHLRRTLRSIDALGASDLRSFWKQYSGIKSVLDTAERHVSRTLIRPSEDAQIPNLPADALVSQRLDICRFPKLSAAVVRPVNGELIDEGCALFHNATRADMCLIQRRNRGRQYAAPYALCVETYDTDGDYVSLKLDLPFADMLRPNHILSVRTHLEADHRITGHLRLALGKGAQVEYLTRSLEIENAEVSNAFDLHFAKTRMDGSQDAWIDLVFSSPSWNRVTLRDAVFVLTPRAEV